MASGPMALIGWLAAVSLLFILIAALVVTLLGVKPEGGENLSFVEATWVSAMRAIDAGALGGDNGWPFRIVMALVTIAGIFIVSSLIGILNSGLESKMDEMRKGRSFVIESNHTLILGWSSNIFTIVSELVIANSNTRNGRIVILADKDKVEMEEEIRAKAGDLGTTKVICRTGSPIDLIDLEIVNPHEARSIIILSPETENPDPQVIKTILALTNNPRRRKAPYHIVAEIRDPKNMEAAHLVSRGEAQLIQTNDLIARITVQTCRQSGMSVIYTELLDYDGDEIYFHNEPTLAGKTFGDALLAYNESAIIGVQHADGTVQVNPPMTSTLDRDDKLIAISGDDDTIVPVTTPIAIDEALIRQAQPEVPTPERTLILGWNRRGCTIATELNSYVAPGSLVTVVSEDEHAESELAHLCGETQTNARITWQHGDTTDRATLDSLDIASYQHIIVLGSGDTMDIQEADARTLITLLHLRNIEEQGGESFSIVSEMLDIRNRELAEVTQADDFIVSDKLISLLLAQVSENKHLNAVFSDLFDSDGSEIYLKLARDYVALESETNFATVVEAARRRGECAIGYRLAAHASNAEKQYGVVVNPSKSERLRFTQNDRVIVIAES